MSSVITWSNPWSEVKASVFIHFNDASDIQKKYVEVAINDFTMHLIISKWLRIQNTKLDYFSCMAMFSKTDLGTLPHLR